MSCAVQMREFAHFQRVNVMTVILKLDVKDFISLAMCLSFFLPGDVLKAIWVLLSMLLAHVNGRDVG